MNIEYSFLLFVFTMKKELNIYGCRKNRYSPFIKYHHFVAAKHLLEIKYNTQ